MDVRIVDVPLSDPRLLAQTPRMPESWGKGETRARFARVGNEFQRHVASVTGSCQVADVWVNVEKIM